MLQTKTYPVIGDIDISAYPKSLAVESNCSLFLITSGACDQSDLGEHGNDGVGDFAENEAWSYR